MQHSENNSRELYERHVFGGFRYRKNPKTFHTPLLEVLRTIPDKAKVLDVGCGAGYLLKRLADQGHDMTRAVACDFSKCALMRACDSGASGIVGDVCLLPFRDGYFDVIICNGVIHHVKNPQEAFAELVRVMAPEGRILFSLYNRNNPYFYLAHRLNYPSRYLYWKGHRWIAKVYISILSPILIPLLYVLYRAATSREEVAVLVMDQIFNPYVHLISKRDMVKIADLLDCEIIFLRNGSLNTLVNASLQRRPIVKG